MQNTYGFNPRRCNSAGSMSRCIEKEMSKIILALPTKYEHVEIFEETVIGEFSCVNTRLAFDSQILLPNLADKTNLENNPMNKNFDYKVVYNLKLDNKKVKQKVITKILKLGENNQYGNAMTKPLPPACIKDDNLYIVDIKFDMKNATEREYAYNEIYPPVIEKHKTIDPCERSVFQLLEQFVR